MASILHGLKWSKRGRMSGLTLLRFAAQAVEAAGSLDLDALTKPCTTQV